MYVCMYLIVQLFFDGSTDIRDKYRYRYVCMFVIDMD